MASCIGNLPEISHEAGTLFTRDFPPRAREQMISTHLPDVRRCLRLWLQVGECSLFTLSFYGVLEKRRTCAYPAEMYVSLTLP